MNLVMPIGHFSKMNGEKNFLIEGMAFLMNLEEEKEVHEIVSTMRLKEFDFI